MQRLVYPICALIFSGVFSVMFFGVPSGDLMALYMAGTAVSAGLPDALYALPLDGLNDAARAPFLYPPIWAWLIAPVTQAVSFEAFANTLLVLQVVMLAVSVGLAWKVVRPPHMELAHFVLVSFAMLAVSAPVFQALGANQPQIISLFLVLLAFERYRAQNFAMAGVILAVAAAFKLAPLFLVLIFLLERNWRAAGAFLATGAALAAMSVALAGWALHARFLERFSFIDNQIILDTTNYAPEVLLYQLQALASGQATGWSLSETLTVAEPFWLSTLMAALMLAALAALILMRPRLIPGTAVPVLLMGFALATALFGPASWGFYFVLPTLLLPTLFHILPRLTAWRWIIALGLLQSFPAYLIYFEMSAALYVTTLMGVLCFGGLLLALVLSVFRAVRFEPDVPLHFR